MVDKKLQWDPLSDIRFPLLPVRCTMSGGGCARLIGHHQDKFEECLNRGCTWPELFKELGLVGKEFVCCRASIQSYSWVYYEKEVDIELKHNQPSSDGNGLWSIHLQEPCSYNIHPRCYRIDAMKGPVFIGYGKQRHKNIMDADNSAPHHAPVVLPSVARFNGELQQKHLDAIDSIRCLTNQT